jgi:hypothetical protein
VPEDSIALYVLQHIGAAGVGASLSCPSDNGFDEMQRGINIGIADHDRIESRDLQRWTLHTQPRLKLGGSIKAESAACALRGYEQREALSVSMSSHYWLLSDISRMYSPKHSPRLILGSYIVRAYNASSSNGLPPTKDCLLSALLKIR